MKSSSGDAVADRFDAQDAGAGRHLLHRGAHGIDRLLRAGLVALHGQADQDRVRRAEFLQPDIAEAEPGRPCCAAPRGRPASGVRTSMVMPPLKSMPFSSPG